MLAVLAEFERDQISNRTISAMRHEGQRVGTVPFGFDLADDGLALDENAVEQATLTLITKLRTEGHSLQASPSLPPGGFRQRAVKPFGCTSRSNESSTGLREVFPTMSKKRKKHSPTVAALYDQLEAAVRSLPADRQALLIKKLEGMEPQAPEPATSGPPTIQTELRIAIKESGLSHYQLAKSAGITPAILDRFMRGERDMRLGTAAKLADVLGLKLVSTKSKASTTKRPRTK
jgi:hypothetical protein